MTDDNPDRRAGIDRRSGHDRREIEAELPKGRERRKTVEPRKIDVTEVSMTYEEWAALQQQYLHQEQQEATDDKSGQSPA